MSSFEDFSVSNAPVGSVRYWEERAEDARVFRGSMHDKRCREMLLDIINAYERLWRA